MAATDIIRTLSKQGINLQLEGANIRARGPLDDTTREIIRTHKPDLLKALSRLAEVDNQGLPFRPCACGNRHFWRDTAGWYCSDCWPISEPNFLGATVTLPEKKVTSMTTKIQWTEKTWNPTLGCSRVSAGCENCYAEAVAERWSRVGTTKDTYEGLVRRVNGHPVWTGTVRLIEKRLNEPKGWKNPARVFVNSMSDLFHERLPLADIRRIFAVMATCPQHTFQVLTKRADRLAELAPELPWPVNVWMGVSVESRATLNRLDALRQVPAAVRFVSFEPLLEDLGAVQLGGLHWAIVGGESAPKRCRRPFDADWARSLRDQCAAHGVAFFMKQVGGFHPKEEAIPLDLRIREYPATRER